ncbi:MAG: hypothetical protein V1752_07170, partial [Candidatus Firestonebacteria bacterium]
MKILGKVLAASLIYGALLFSCPAVDGWTVDPEPAFVNEDVKVSCTIKPGAGQNIDSWTMTLSEGATKKDEKSGGGG